jgi:hypothetical protein
MKHYILCLHLNQLLTPDLNYIPKFQLLSNLPYYQSSLLYFPSPFSPSILNPLFLFLLSPSPSFPFLDHSDLNPLCDPKQQY